MTNQTVSEKKQLLHKIVCEAYMHVPYYRQLYNQAGIDPCSETFDSCFHRLPIVHKDELLSQGDAFLSDAFDKTDLMHERTSGSTGKILDLYFDRIDRTRAVMSLWSKRKIRYGIVPEDKRCYFHSIAYRTSVAGEKQQVFSPRIMLREHGRVLSLSKLDFSEEMLYNYYKHIYNFEPTWIFCFPSTLYIFSQFMIKNNLPPFPSLRFIELTGEFLLPLYRHKIEEVFQVPVANQYGATELGGIAYECPCGRLHLLSRNVEVEILEYGQPVAPGKSGRIAVTGLHNRAMPLIRYDLGDRGRIEIGEDCTCGDKNPVIVLEAGRGNELVRCGENEVECVVFYYLIEQVNAELDGAVSQFQVVQRAPDRFDVRLVRANPSGGPDEAQIAAAFSDRAIQQGFSGVCWNFDFTDRILPDENSDKINFFLSEPDAAFSL